MEDDNDERLQKQGFMSQALIPMIAVLAFGGGVGLLSNDRPGVRDQIAFNQRFGTSERPGELSPAGYEALRDMVVINPTIVPAVIRAYEDDVIDTVEMRSIVGDQRSRPQETTLDLPHARGDLAATLNAYSQEAFR